MKLDLDAIEARAKAATPGPWRSMADGNQYVNTRYMPTAKAVGASRVEPLVRPWNPHALLAFGFEPKEYETARFLDADADHIAGLSPDVALALVGRVRELEKVRDERDAALVALKRIAFEPFGPADATHQQVLDAVTKLARAALEGK